jgi:MOSC domain-containing protein YiiM
MRIETVAVGTPRSVNHEGRSVTTSIFKTAVAGPVWIRRHNLEGDRQADLSVHGGEHKAVYAYAAEHYDFWRRELGRDLEPAAFGENLTIRGLEEPEVAIGDVLRIGEAELAAAAPRLPCYKLGIRFDDPGMVRTFARRRRYGIYFRILREGRVAPGDPASWVRRGEPRVPVYEIARLRLDEPGDLAAIRRLLAVSELDPGWREHFESALGAPGGPAAPAEPEPPRGKAR